MPGGERSYLARLSCADGNHPAFSRDGSVGLDTYGFIMDLYSVGCAGNPATKVYMDMYHDKGETRPIAGFSLP